MTNDLFSRFRQAEQDIRWLRARLQAISSGGLLRATAIGVIPTGSGGTGSSVGPLGVMPVFVNDSGGALSEGAVVVFDSAGGREVKTTTTAGDRLVAGIVRGDLAPYAAGAETPVLMLGYHAGILVTGAVSVGDYLRTSTTAGRAISASTDPEAGVFALALSAAPGPGNGTVAAFVFPGPMTRSIEEVQAKGDLLLGAGPRDLDRLAASGVAGRMLAENPATATGWEIVDPLTLFLNRGRFYVCFGVDLAGRVVSP